MMSIFRTKLFLYLLTLPFFFSCEEEEPNGQTSIGQISVEADTVWMNSSSKPDIIVQDGILHFATPDIYDQTLESMKAMTIEEMLKWSKQLEFMSMQRSFQSLVDEQTKIYEEMQALENQTANLSQQELETFIANSSNQIQELKDRKSLLMSQAYGFEIDENLIVGMKIHDYYASALVNSEGLVVVANNLLQYTDDQIKIGPYAKGANTESIVNATVSDQSKGIFVEDINPKSADSRTQGSVEREEYCHFTYDPDHDGDNYGNAVLELVKIRKAVYKTIYQNNCECVQLLPPRDRDKENEEICAVYECTRVPIRVFSHWKYTELRVSGEMRTYGRSCKTWSIFTGCDNSPSDANLHIQVSSSSNFVLPNGSRLLTRNNVSIIGFTKSYNLNYQSIPSNVTLIYGAINTYSGGLGSCTISIPTNFK